jgi:hypothetical protein
VSDPFLTDDEIARMTKPLKQGAARCRYFRSLGIKVDPRPDGQPLVGRAEFEAARLAPERATAVQAPPGSNVVSIDRDGLRARQERGKRPPRAA